MKPEPFKATIDGQAVICDSNLTAFDIYKRASTYVAYFAISKEQSLMFFQFNNGKCFLYRDVPAEVLDEAITVESIGKFYHATIKGKYEDQPVKDNCVAQDNSPVSNYTEDLDIKGDPRDDFDDLGSNAHGLSFDDEDDLDNEY